MNKGFSAKKMKIMVYIFVPLIYFLSTFIHTDSSIQTDGQADLLAFNCSALLHSAKQAYSVVAKANNMTCSDLGEDYN